MNRMRVVTGSWPCTGPTVTAASPPRTTPARKRIMAHLESWRGNDVTELNGGERQTRTNLAWLETEIVWDHDCADIASRPRSARLPHLEPVPLRVRGPAETAVVV